MKRLFSYIDLAIWTIVLVGGILLLTKGGQIPSFTAMLAILLCFLGRFVRIIQHEQITVEVTTTKDESKEETNENYD